MDLLGNSIEKIAAEKSGIIKRGIPVALGPMREEAMDVMKAVSIKNNAKIYHDLAVDIGFVRHLALKGNYQLEVYKIRNDFDFLLLVMAIQNFIHFHLLIARTKCCNT